MESIRIAAPADIAHIAELANRDASWIVRVRSGMARGQLDIFLACQEESLRLLGYAMIRTRPVVEPPPAYVAFTRLLSSLRRYPRAADPASLLQSMPIATVQDVFVRPEHRHCGIGTALVRHVIGHAHSAGIDDIRVNLAADSELQPFCQSLGFLPM